MKNEQKNYYVLSIGIVYIIIAIIQATLNGLLPAWLYFSLAFVTINITLGETIKFLIKELISIYQHQIDTIEFVESNISVLKNYNGIKEELEALEKANIKVANYYNKGNCETNLKNLSIILKITEFFEIFLCALTILLAPLKVIPYDLFTNKLISSFTLVSFSFTCFSLYVTRVANSFKVYYHTDNNSIIKYYQRIIEKIINDKETNENV